VDVVFKFLKNIFIFINLLFVIIQFIALNYLAFINFLILFVNPTILHNLALF